MFSVGRVCLKIAGRDAGKKCVIVKHMEGKIYLVDGETRRRKCNTLHLEPTEQTLEIKENASHEEVIKAFKAIGIELAVKKPRQKTEKPKKAAKQVTPESKPKKTKK